ncbi:DNA polymerase III subunit epsilon [Mycoavidus cysteinexigens]|uniref:DNA polymerase III subunit epsilon n=1 Tax=Mycoavidus cysteinexigens TaxID=1553431 RepID=A0A2Z6EXQ4_9BURK|nr:DNA polymerase III subunit epsilon [Mycoavidus cysteinexigens]BBE10240.1 DNA polymerase III subunit epsilon [Mycoavidus cysteinexigens]GAM53397.1 DNA polymerase III epsilon subunit [bacterium endosymbiont of Mortierella elongata FMR23-6]GLR00657.1 DNA polymerase III subunit epsilon [Mycoavidus cysteinexigens]
MRQLVVDTETTGLSARGGDRIIEIGCVELINRQLTGKHLHFYINPERDSDPGALAVHGLTTEFLSDKPKFAQIANELCDFVKDAQIIIHNAPFDIGFLDAELALLGLASFNQQCGTEVIDTLVHARQIFPGKRNSLDALCERFSINNAHRTLHGALLDAELLALVYLAMTRGQEDLLLDAHNESCADTHQHSSIALDQLRLPVLSATPDEISAHTVLLDELEKTSKIQSVWRTAAL